MLLHQRCRRRSEIDAAHLGPPGQHPYILLQRPPLHAVAQPFRDRLACILEGHGPPGYPMIHGDDVEAEEVKISVDAVPDTTFPGTVTEIGNTAKRSLTSTVEGQTDFEVKVVFDDNVPQVRPGMTADVNIDTGTREKTLVVPIQSVVVRTQRELDRAARKPGERAKRSKAATVSAEEDTVGRRDAEITGVFVSRNGVAAFVPVRTGLSSETMIEIFGDLKEGDTVVSGPYKALRDLKPGGKVKKEAAGKEKK